MKFFAFERELLVVVRVVASNAFNLNFNSNGNLNFNRNNAKSNAYRVRPVLACLSRLRKKDV